MRKSFERPWPPTGLREMAPGRFRPPPVPASAGAAEVYRRTLAACWARWEIHRKGSGRDPESVHQCRVALRRLRALLKGARPFLSKRERRFLRKEARRLAQGLGVVRDWDVFRAWVERRLESPAERKALRQAIAGARNRAHRRVRAARAGKRWRGFQSGVEEALHARPLKCPPVSQWARSLLHRRCARVRRAGEGLPRLSGKGLHRLRIAVKNLRYTVDVFGRFSPRFQSRNAQKALRDLQSVLGEIQDVRTAQRLLTHREMTLSRGARSRIEKELRHRARRARSDLASCWRSVQFLQ